MLIHNFTTNLKKKKFRSITKIANDLNGKFSVGRIRFTRHTEHMLSWVYT